MAYQNPYLRLSQLQEERFGQRSQEREKAQREFGQGFLSLKSLGEDLQNQQRLAEEAKAQRAKEAAEMAFKMSQLDQERERTMETGRHNRAVEGIQGQEANLKADTEKRAKEKADLEAKLSRVKGFGEAEAQKVGLYTDGTHKKLRERDALIGQGLVALQDAYNQSLASRGEPAEPLSEEARQYYANLLGERYDKEHALLFGAEEKQKDRAAAAHRAAMLADATKTRQQTSLVGLSGDERKDLAANQAIVRGTDGLIRELEKDPRSFAKGLLDEIANKVGLPTEENYAEVQAVAISYLKSKFGQAVTNTEASFGSYLPLRAWKDPEQLIKGFRAMRADAVRNFMSRVDIADRNAKMRNLPFDAEALLESIKPVEEQTDTFNFLKGE